MTESLGDSQLFTPASEQTGGHRGHGAGVEGASLQVPPTLLSSASCPPPPCPPLSQCPHPPSTACLKHKQAPVFTSCHSGSRQAGNRNQDCLDWGLDRTGRSHALQRVQGVFSERAGVATGSGRATCGRDSPTTGGCLGNHKAQLLILEKMEIKPQTGQETCPRSDGIQWQLQEYSPGVQTPRPPLSPFCLPTQGAASA